MGLARLAILSRIILLRKSLLSLTMSVSTKAAQLKTTDPAEVGSKLRADTRTARNQPKNERIPREFLGQCEEAHPRSIPADTFYAGESGVQSLGERRPHRTFKPDSKYQAADLNSLVRPKADAVNKTQTPKIKDPEKSSSFTARTPQTMSSATLSPPALQTNNAMVDTEIKTYSTDGRFYSIKVVMGLIANLPENMCITKNRAPCALFAVEDSRTGHIEGYFVKEYSQLCNFRNVVVSILLPLLKSNDVRLTEFPRKSLFTREVPWRVDVRTDMLNAFFKSLSQARESTAFQNNPHIRSALDQACSALWLYDIVELPRFDAQHMCGYLMSKIGSNKWNVNYCIINGSFVDVIRNSTRPPVSKSISLKNARIVSKVVFFNTTDEDERYSFEIYEKTFNSSYIIHQFSAESDKIRQMWLSKLREIVQSIDSRILNPSYRQYTDNNIPMPYKLKFSPHLSAYLPESNKDNSVSEITSKFASENSSEASLIGDGTSTEQQIGKRRKKKGTKNKQGEPQLFDGDGFYMQISKPLNSQILDDALTTVPEDDPYDIVANQTKTFRSNDKTSPEGISLSQPSNFRKQETASSPKSFENAAMNGIKTSVTPNIMDLQNAMPNQIPKGKVFGQDPGSCEYLLRYHGDSVPSIVARCLGVLNKDSSLRETGLFRISGTRTLVEGLQSEFNSRGDCNFDKYQPDVHTVADLLKRYLRSLPQPILGSWSASESKALFEQDRRGKISILNVVLMKRNPNTIATVRRILHLLKKVSQYEAVNAMSIWNLSVALSPCLKVPPHVVQIYIQVEADLFGPISQLEWSIMK